MRDFSSMSDAATTHSAEWRTRIDLAACYRLCALLGWDDGIHTQITAAIPGALLVKRPGERYDEVRASSLVKVAVGELALHEAVHAARPDVACVMHLHNRHAIAVGIQENGLLPLTQHAIRLCGQLAYHDYEGPTFGPLECARLVLRLRTRPAMMLRNHGSLVVAASVGEAFLLMAALDKACEMQLMAQASGARLHSPPAAVCRKAQMDMASDETAQLAWSAWLRKLDTLDATYST